MHKYTTFEDWKIFLKQKDVAIYTISNFVTFMLKCKVQSPQVRNKIFALKFNNYKFRTPPMGFNRLFFISSKRLKML